VIQKIIKFILWCSAVTVIAHSHAQDKCRSESVDTSVGKLHHLICRNADREYTHTIFLGEQPLLRNAFLAEADNNKSRSIWVYVPQAQLQTACPDRLYLIDLSQNPVKVIAFGVKKACNEFHWASWGEKRSVVTLKHNVKFTYENGKMILPKPGEKLWSSIEPPHAGEGLAMEDAIPFAEDVPPPK